MSAWQEILRKNFTVFEELSRFLELDEKNRLKVYATPKFSINVPYRIATKMAKNNLEDPLFKQFIPMKEELIEKEGDSLDPLEENKFLIEPKLLCKYPGRALILTTGNCAMNCRFCFRQNFDYEREQKGFELEIKKIIANTSLSEVLLSGGDPLSLSNRSLRELMLQLDSVPHLKRVRFHTRFPIGIPERIDQELLDILLNTRLQCYFVIHSNHPREWDEDIDEAMAKIQKLGIPILSQTVLLKGVNDSVETLVELFERFADRGILPYYLHQLDRVEGASHFEVSEKKGLHLLEQLGGRLPGYALPRYVKEVPGHCSKLEIMPYIVI